MYRTKLLVCSVQLIKLDRELDIATSDDVLNFEILEDYFESQLLDHSGILTSCKEWMLLAFCTSDDHFSYRRLVNLSSGWKKLTRSKNQSGCFRVTKSNNDGGKSLKDKFRSLLYGKRSTLGLYSAFLAFKAICFKSSLQLRLTVDTIFLEGSLNILFSNKVQYWRTG